MLLMVFLEVGEGGVQKDTAAIEAITHPHQLTVFQKSAVEVRYEAEITAKS